ncbi:MAG: hypothetical protein CXR30_05790 [Geobacter sp.]|nr:MAG: hypothetical protein CXR30_05790 [Geobacter sp.]
MSFSGDLQHLPIVDVIQLLHSTRKTGTLYLKSHKGESQLTFNDGYFVSANHVNNSVRIGRILVEMNVITHEELEQALLEQKNAGANRKPLVATLIEGGKINKDDAYKGLESLIEMTIVEILTWTSGAFTLDVDKIDVSDEYRYFPETLKQDLSMNTQSVLMDALRIYDEKKRDGTLNDGSLSGDENSPELPPGSGETSDGITADLLGLDDLDTLEKRIPDVFTGLRDHSPVNIHRQNIGKSLVGLPPEEQDKLIAFLDNLSAAPATVSSLGHQTNLALAVIVFSRDEVVKYISTVICKQEGLFVFTTDEEVNLDHIIDQTLSKGLQPVLVIDTPKELGPGFDRDTEVALVQAKRAKYPTLSILQLATPQDLDTSLHALQAGIRAVLPRAGQTDGKGSFVNDTIAYMETFRSYLKTSFTGTDQQFLHQFRESMLQLDTLKDAPDLVFVILRFASLLFERSITFIVGKSELIAEKGIGIKSAKDAGPTAALLYRIPLGQPSLFQDVINSGSLYFGPSNDSTMEDHLFDKIDPPLNSKILLLPIKSFGRVFALIYADFGSKTATPPALEFLDTLSRHASLVLDNAFYRKKFEKPAQPQ